MRDALLVHLLAVFINDHHIMVLVCPVNADIPHRLVLLGGLRSPRGVVALYCGARGAAFYDRFTLRELKRKANLSQTVEPVEGDSLSASAS
jgi:hypothetical protein